jgi:hypothetical protein
MSGIAEDAPIILMHALSPPASPLEMTTANRQCLTFAPLLPRFCLGQRGWADYHEDRRQQRRVAAT